MVKISIRNNFIHSLNFILQLTKTELFPGSVRLKMIIKQVGARCSSVVDRPFTVCWIIGSIPHGGPIQLFLVLVSAPRLV